MRRLDTTRPYHGIVHRGVMVKRPTLPDGRRLVRYGSGLSASRRTDLSDEVCAICGYGLTKQQMLTGKPAPETEHQAIPLIEFAAWDWRKAYA